MRIVLFNFMGFLLFLLLLLLFLGFWRCWGCDFVDSILGENGGLCVNFGGFETDATFLF